MSVVSECCRRLSLQGVGSYEELMRLSLRVELPWCGVKLSGCVGMLYNGGLYTQCGKSFEGEYCVGCIGRKESGKWNGDVSERMKCKIGEYSVGGKKEVSYMKWLSKNGVSREMAERYAESRGLSIPLEHFVERESRRGRPRKSELVVESVELKSELVVESVELKSELVVESVELKSELVVEPVKKKRGRPQKSELVVESVVESVELKSELVVEPVKKKRGRPRKEKSMSSNNEGEELIASLLKERKESELCVVVNDVSSSSSEKEASSDAEEETLVIKIEIDGKTYLKSEDNTVFDFMSHDELGIWNEKENKIVLG